MKNVRTYAVLVSVAASLSVLSACSDNEADDAGAALESPATSGPSTEAPAPGVTQTPAPAPAPEPEPAEGSSGMAEPGPEGGATGTAGSADDSATDITPEPDSQ